MRNQRKIYLLGILLIAIIALIAFIPTKSNAADVAKIGDQPYESLVAAVSAAENGQTVTLLEDSAGNGIRIDNNKEVVIDFANHTYTINGDLVGSVDKLIGLQLINGSNVTLKNGTLKSNSTVTLIQNYCNLTITDMTLVAPNADYVLSNNCGKVTINGETNITAGDGKNAFDMCWAATRYSAGTQITVDTTGTITGNIELGFWDCEDGTDAKSTLNIININHNGKIMAEDTLKDKLTISGGTYTSDVTEYLEKGKGYVCKEIDDGKYKVGTEHNITVSATEGGTVKVTPEKAIAGEKITVTITANENYEVSSKTMNGTALESNEFTMPDEEVTIKVEFKEVETEVNGTEVIVPEVNAETEVEKVVVGVAPEDKEKIDEILKANVEKLFADLEDATVELSIENNATVEEELKTKIADAINDIKNVNVADYFNIDIKVNGTEKIEELSDKIKLTVAIPEDLQTVKEGYNRKYYVVRVHGDSIDILDTVVSEDGKSLTFESDKFSVYVLAYADEEAQVAENPNVPATGDNIVLYVVIAVVAVAGISTIVINRKKQLKH